MWNLVQQRPPDLLNLCAVINGFVEAAKSASDVMFWFDGVGRESAIVWSGWPSVTCRTRAVARPSHIVSYIERKTS